MQISLLCCLFVNALPLHSIHLYFFVVRSNLNEKLYNKSSFCFRDIFTNPETGKIKKVGETVAFPALAETYRRIAKEGVDTFYNGSLRDDIIADLEELGNLDLKILLLIVIMFMFRRHILKPKDW